MAITVKHTKVSTIPDGNDSSLIRPSDWNEDHTLIGLGTMAEQNANSVAITGGTISGVTLPASNITGTLGVPNGGTGATTLTGYVKGTGTTAMTASATIPNTDITGLGTASTKDAGVALGVATLDASGKVPTSQIPMQGDLNYQGTWNASTNTPTLTSSVGTQGYYYVVDVAGSTNLNGITDWNIGDWAIFNGSIWQKVDNTDAVTSVNGQVGTVVLTTTNIAEGTNEYFTTAKARTSISAGTGISYDNSTGVVTNAAPDQVVALNGAGTTTVTGTYPNFTITSNDEFDGDVVGPASATDNAIARFDTTTGKLIQNSIVTVSDAGAVSGVINETFTPVTAPAYAEGRVFYDTDAKTLCYYNDNNQMTINIGQENIVRVRNQTGADLTNGTVVYISGATGNTPTVAKAIATSFATADIIGVLTTDIANNGFGYATTTGLVNGIDTSAFTEGDAVFLSATTAGTFTATEPSRPNYSIQVGVILRANPSVGTLLVAIQVISTENIHIIGTLAVNQGGTGQTTYTDGQLLIGNTTGNTLTKSTLTAGTAIGITNGAGSISIANTGVTSAVAGTGISVSGATGAVTVTNTAPDQTVAIASGTGISVSGTYPNFTVTNTAPSSGGTVTSVSGTAPIASSGGNTPAISISQATTSTNGYLSSTDWNTFNGKQPAGTYVNSVSATSPITSTGGTTPTIAMPAATGSVNGYLTSTDWTTFNSKGSGTVTSVGGTGTVNGLTLTGTVTSSGNLTLGGTLNLSSPPAIGNTTPNTVAGTVIQATNGIVVNSNTVSASYTIPSGSSAMSAGPMTVVSGQAVTVSSGSRWVIL